MKLYRLLFFLLICTAQVSNAQVILLTELFKNDGRQVDSADSADYVRIVDAPDSAAKTVIIREFYADGSRKSIANATSWMPIQYEGAYHSFHPNGKRKEISSYHKGDLIDTTYNFYPMDSCILLNMRSHPLKTQLIRDNLNDPFISN